MGPSITSWEVELVDFRVYAKTLHFELYISLIDWIKSPADVPMPTQRERSEPVLAPVGAFGRVSVAVDE